MNRQALTVGTVLEADRGLYRHCGLVYGFRGSDPVVISNLPGGAQLQSVAQFANGKEVRVVGYPSQFSSWQVIARALSVANRPYSWLSWNCEHLVNYAHGLRIESQQVNRWIALAGLVSVTVALAKA